jgi:hypothetical protein
MEDGIFEPQTTQAMTGLSASSMAHGKCEDVVAWVCWCNQLKRVPRRVVVVGWFLTGAWGKKRFILSRFAKMGWNCAMHQPEQREMKVGRGYLQKHRHLSATPLAERFCVGRCIGIGSSAKMPLSSFVACYACYPESDHRCATAVEDKPEGGHQTTGAHW